MVLAPRRALADRLRPVVAAAPARLEPREQLAAAGEEARMLPGLPMKLVVVDRRTHCCR